MATKSHARLNRQFDRLQRRIPDFAARLLERIRRPEARWIRIPLGLLLILGGLDGLVPTRATAGGNEGVPCRMAGRRLDAQRKRL